MRIKVGETVAILAGKDRFVTDESGKKMIKTGKVLKVFAKTQKIIVEGVNIKTKHQPPSQNEEKGAIVKQEAPIHVSNVALVDPQTQTSTKVGIRIQSGKKVRYAKKSNQTLDEKN
ncbi:LSU ribosomal protein L24p (L26e) [Candidatus Phytoplasma asteris]|uniref:Large ribosomal subunit protein uL24 n=3 Tax=16SrI (Aster yellows group) TaxID=3042590 RepID=RL24_AYWBP|nr:MULTISPECIES: 50S ribosomal protein L24 [16SrI (Aster yellows group)]Q2NIW5.1 RecName: Full=Large ribosomal subunit protein uL24; AltName: Full=50S ribosomal protein L24 [Aster yellows witches'-broom phytoplasma AYWB]ABC65628.1 LSU ribosomal protein L24P [Aster yellows witches'-broom phytoplasma AYWB]PEH36215.1 50S ribosomal protein L24 [New Jersey aster yellows phytoplasma]